MTKHSESNAEFSGEQYVTINGLYDKINAASLPGCDVEKGSEPGLTPGGTRENDDLEYKIVTLPSGTVVTVYRGDSTTESAPGGIDELIKRLPKEKQSPKEAIEKIAAETQSDIALDGEDPFGPGTGMQHPWDNRTL